MTHSRSIVRRTWHQFDEDRCMLLAAGIAFYALFSFVPLATLTLAILGFVMRDPQSQQSAVDRILQQYPLPAGPGQNIMLDAIRRLSSESPGLTLLGTLGLIWASGGLFGAVRSSLNIAWGAEPHGLVRQRLMDIGAVFGLGFMLILSIAASIAVHLAEAYSLRLGGGGLVPLDRMWLFIGLLMPALTTFVAFLLLYRNVPNVRHGARDVWPGALLATVLFELSKHGFGLYVSHFHRYQEVNGVLGGVMLFMLWTYLGAIITLLGAEFASEFEGRRHQHDALALPAEPHLTYASRAR